ncbi:MAG: class I SAM-dependent methyltransferase [Gaiellaceae bacterium]
MVAATEASGRRDALVERLFGATLGTFDIVAVYLGVRLGLYRALDDLGTAQSHELAAAAGLNERYVREWLEQQATSGILDGEGHSSMAIARAYPKVHVDGIDLDEASIAAAKENLAGSDVEDRVTFHRRDAADADLQGKYDLVYIHESLHDMSYPVEVLQACRGLLAEGGSVVVGDERVADAFSAPGDDIERFHYGFSVLHCLPVGMVGEGAAGTGTVMRAGTVRRYAEAAGLRGFEVLPIENDFYRFYRLTP